MHVGAAQVGSLLYMAPEVLIGHVYNEKVDVFAFGIILFELMCGQLLYSRIAVVGEVDSMLVYAQEVRRGHGEHETVRQQTNFNSHKQPAFAHTSSQQHVCFQWHGNSRVFFL